MNRGFAIPMRPHTFGLIQGLTDAAQWVEKLIWIIVPTLMGLFLGWVLGTFKKVDPKTLEEKLTGIKLEAAKENEQIKARISKMEADTEKYARQRSIDDLNIRVDKLETKIDNGFENLRQLILAKLKD